MNQSKNENSRHTVKKIKNVLQNRWAAYTFATCSAVVLYVLLMNLDGIWSGIGSLYQIISPVIVGVVIAYLINPMANFLECKVFRKLRKEKDRHTISVILSLVCVLLVVVLLLVALIPSLGRSFEGIIGNMDSYKVTIESYIERLSGLAAKLNLDISGLTASWDKFLNDFMSNLSSNLMKVLSASYNVGVGAFNLVVGFILAIYFLLDKKNMTAGICKLRHSILTDEKYEKRTAFWTRCHNILMQYIIYNLLDGLIIGCLNAVLMLFFGMPYLVLISVIVSFTNLLPTFGPLIGAVLGGLILVLSDPMQALIFLIFTVVIQVFDGYILKPKLFGGSLGVPAVWILITIIVGGKMFGVIGILLAIPFAAIFTFVYDERILPWLEERKQRKPE